MSRRRKRKTSKIKAHIQGRKLRCIRAVRPLAGGLFAYRGFVFDIEDFPPHSTVNLDSTKVRPIREFEGSVDRSSIRKNKNKKQKLRKKTYAAQIYSNLGECTDAHTILHQTAA